LIGFKSLRFKQYIWLSTDIVIKTKDEKIFKKYLLLKKKLRQQELSKNIFIEST